ncbi:MAG: hypothetical protein LBT11_03595, partial [Treponema sp.]|nr:hypothetical protein [Treponema sp.]
SWGGVGFIRGEGLILAPLGRFKGIKPESNTFREQHASLLCGGVVDCTLRLSQNISLGKVVC